MKLINDESGNVYTWIMLCVVIIIMAGIYLISIQVVDPLVEKHDELNDKDKITEQNVECFNFSLKFFNAFPIFVIFGLAAWAIITTIRSKGD